MLANFPAAAYHGLAPAAWHWLGAITAGLAAAPGPESRGHADPVAPILIALVLIAFGAMLGGHLVRKLGQPAVLGELLVGMLVANAAYYLHEPVITILREGETARAILHAAMTRSISLAEAARHLLPATAHTERLIEILNSSSGAVAILVYEFVDNLSRIAIVILLFLVGLETSVRELRKVGWTSFFVALLGIVCPFLLGVGGMRLLAPDSPLNVALFVGVILVATSVGITARIFRDLQQEHRPEAKIILSAAVMDDVLGLLFLAILSGYIDSGTVNFGAISLITVKAVAFLAGSIGIGVWVTPRLVRRMARLEIRNLKLLFGLGIAFVFAWIASKMGLATIIGAFAAGLALEEFFFQELKEEHSLRHLLSPLESLIVPVFFVLMGMQVKLETFGDWRVVVIAGVITAAAVAGKVLSGLACTSPLSRLAVGVGMMPRGEVALIFASVGKGLGVISEGIFSAVVIMVMVTTLLTPPLLRFALLTPGRTKLNA